MDQHDHSRVGARIGVAWIERDFLTQAIIDVLEGNDLRIKEDQAGQVVKVQMQRLNFKMTSKLRKR